MIVVYLLPDLRRFSFELLHKLQGIAGRHGIAAVSKGRAEESLDHVGDLKDATSNPEGFLSSFILNEMRAHTTCNARTDQHHVEP